MGGKHAKRYAARDSPKNVGSFATAGTFGQESLPTEEITMEKSDHPNQSDGMSQLQQKQSDRVAVVSSQHGVMLPGSQSGILTLVQEDMNARDMSTVPAHSMPRGKALRCAVFNNTSSNLLGLINFNRDYKNSCVVSYGLCAVIWIKRRNTVSIWRENENV